MRFIFLLLPFLCVPACAQSLSYADADTPGEAVGMMNTTLVTNRIMLSECTKRFPEHEDGMYRDIRSWEEKERPQILKARAIWSEMSKRDAKLSDFNAYIESMVMKNIDMLANAPTDEASKFLSEHCRKHFSDLASGVWRTRTPRAYSFLDELR